MITRKIPSSGEELPVVGLGTWKTFDVVGKDSFKSLYDVLNIMKNEGAKVIDSSPMYGNAERVIGDLTSDPKYSDSFFYATKVWTNGKDNGIKQIEDSFRKMKRTIIDLMQVHNLTDWRTHLKTLRELKSEGRIRYIGVTHYVDSMHVELERIIRNEKIDFIQFNYSILSRSADKTLLPMSADKGVAVLINKPFGTGTVFSKVKGKPLPPWASELGIKSWGTYLLKYIISHPAVTCVIPATSNAEHAEDNFQALHDPIPDESTRKKMVDYLKSL